MGRLGELDVGVLDDLDAVAPGIEKSEEGAFDHRRAGRLGALLHTRAVVDDKADMATLDAARFAVRHPRHVDELVPHVDKGAALAPAAQVEVEELAVPVERLVDVADLDRHMIDADQPGLLAVAHLHPPVLQDACRYLSPTALSRASAAKTKPQREGHKGYVKARRHSPPSRPLRVRGVLRVEAL